jgi:hypothetical protein
LFFSCHVTSISTSFGHQKAETFFCLLFSRLLSLSLLSAMSPSSSLSLVLFLLFLSITSSADVTTSIQSTFYLSNDMRQQQQQLGQEREEGGVLTSRDIYTVTSGSWGQLQGDLNTFFLISQGAFVFLLQLSFPLLEGGNKPPISRSLSRSLCLLDT